MTCLSGDPRDDLSGVCDPRDDLSGVCDPRVTCQVSVTRGMTCLSGKCDPRDDLPGVCDRRGEGMIGLGKWWGGEGGLGEERVVGRDRGGGSERE